MYILSADKRNTVIQGKHSNVLWVRNECARYALARNTEMLLLTLRIPQGAFNSNKSRSNSHSGTRSKGSCCVKYDFNIMLNGGASRLEIVEYCASRTIGWDRAGRDTKVRSVAEKEQKEAEIWILFAFMQTREEAFRAQPCDLLLLK